MWHETANLKDDIDYVAMDSKAESYLFFRELKRKRSIILVTNCRRKTKKLKTESKSINCSTDQSSNKFTKNDHTVSN